MVPPPLADRLRRVRRSCGDSLADLPPHITVIPPTPVARAALPALVRQIETRAASFGRFQVRLTGAGTFRPVSPVVYARLAKGFESCQALEAQLRPAFDGLEDRFPYYPHVTVAQDTPDAGLDGAEQAISQLDETFVVTGVDICLLRSDAVWQPLHHAQLAPAGQGQPAKESV
jgi:2'-5' RNA ligase